MTRQRAILTQKNYDWLKEQLEKEKFSSKCKTINYLIKKARSQKGYYEFMRNKIVKAEKSGHSTLTKKELLAKIKSKYTNQ
jgi:antitoxin ParD1/3/4